MVITTLEKYKGEMFCVIADGNKRAYLHRDIISKFQLQEGMEISRERFSEVLFATGTETCGKKSHVPYK